MRSKSYTYSRNDDLKQGHNLLSLTDPNDNVYLELAHDGNDQLTSIKHGGVGISVSAGPSAATVDGNGHTRSYGHNQAGNPVSVTAGGFTTSLQYNQDGLLTRIVHPEGNSVDYGYDSGNDQRRSQANLLSVSENPGPRGGDELNTSFSYETGTNQVISQTDPRGNRTVYSRDGINGNLQSISDAGGAVYEYSSNTYGQVTRITDPSGAGTVFSYYPETAPGGTGLSREAGRRLDPATGGYLASVVVDQGGDGLSAAYAYDELGNVTQAIDGEGIARQTSYDTFNQPVAQSRGAGAAVSAMTYSYDANGNLLTVSGQGIAESYTYNQANLPLSLTRVGGGLSQVYHYSYDANFNLTAIQHPGGNLYTFVYNERNLPVEQDLAGLGSTSFAYDGNGNRTVFYDGLGAAWETIYDGHDRVIGRRDPLGNTISFSLDKNGNPVSVRGPEGLVIENSYDALDRLVESSSAPGIRELYQYDPAGRLRQYTSPAGHAWSFSQGGSGLLKSLTDPLGNAGSFSYDKRGLLQGQVETESGGRSLSRSFSYNALGRLTGTQDSLQRSWRHNYDPLSQVPLDRLDPENGAVGFSHDGLHRLNRETRHLAYRGTQTAAAVSYEYDANDNVILVRDGNGNETHYEYDARDRLTGVRYADGGSESYTYDANDRLLSSTDANGTRVANSYDAAGRLTGRIISPAVGIIGPTRESYVYDGLNRLTRAENGNTITDFSYDAAGRLTREVQQRLDGAIIVSTYEVASGYDANGNKVSLSYPSGRQLSVGYDALDRVAEVRAADKSIAAYSYEGRAKVREKILAGALRLSAEYDEGRRPTGMSYSNTGSGSVIMGREMSWSKTDLKTAETRRDDPARSKSFEYDSAYRLRRSSTALEESSFSMDAADNIRRIDEQKGEYTSSLSHQVNSRNQLVSLDGSELSYDAAGNLVGIIRPEENTAYVYDYRNQLLRVESPGLNVSFTYDALGRRVSKTVQRANSPTAQVNYVYDGLRVIEERDGGGVLLARYAYGNGLDEPLEIERRIADTLQSHLPMQDSVGNVIGLADSSGKLLEQVSYSSFGAAAFTYDHEPPRLDQLRVVDGLVRVRFSEPVEQGSLQKAWRLSTGQGQLAGSFSYGEADRLAVFTPSQPLPQGQALEVRISTELADKSGNRLEQEFTRSFTYRGAGLLVFDRGPPEVERIRLEGRVLRVLFSEEIAGDNLEGALRLGRNGAAVPGALLLEDEKTLRFSAAVNLVTGGHYLLELSGSVRDLSGKALAPVRESFVYRGGKQLVYEKPAADEHRKSYVGNTTLFQGREYDYETGLYYFRARYYHPELGRFLQTDPKGYIDSMNLYQAFGNNPVNFTDPLGTVVAKGIHPEVAMSAYRQFRRGGYSHSIAYKNLIHYRYVTDTGSNRDLMYEISLASLALTDQFSTSPAQIGRDVAAGSINSLVRIVGLAAKAGAHGNTAMSLAAEHVESRVTGGISSALGADEGSLAYWLGETYAPVAAGSAVAGIMGPSSGASVIPTIKKEIRFNPKAMRYYDNQTGRFIKKSDVPWPKNDGFVSKIEVTAKKGKIVDRYGSEKGSFLSPVGTPYEKRGIPKGIIEYHKYEILKPFNLYKGKAQGVPEFGSPGKGTQYMLKSNWNIEELIAKGYLKRIE